MSNDNKTIVLAEFVLVLYCYLSSQATYSPVQKVRIEQMTKREVYEILDELIEKIEDGPNSHIGILTQINQQLELRELSEVILELDESLEAMRLIVKYLLFDLEATCRERDQLRSILEDEK